ncbi:MAG: ABC transporter substrate-binding protein [Aliidongia sp.]
MTPFRLDRRGLLKASGAAVLLASGRRVFAAVEGDTLSLRSESDIEALDPAFEKGGVEEELCRCLFVTLNRLNDFRAPLGWTLYAAETLEQPDPRQIRFRLRPGIRWSGDWGTLSAEDVKYTLERVAGAAESPYTYLYSALDRVEVVDALTGIIHLKAPRVAFLLTALPWYSGHILCRAAMEQAGGRFTVAPPATCGPYRIEEWRPGQSIALAANPDWAGDKPAFARIRYAVIPDDEVAALAYEAGSVDLTRISLNTLSIYQKTPPAGSRLIAAPGTRIVFLALNIQHPKLADARIRRAIQQAIDVEDILLGAYGGIGRRSTGPIPPGMTGHRPSNLTECDPAAAKALLAEAGVQDLRLVLLALNDTVYMTTALIIQAQLREIGVSIEIKSLDAGTYWALGEAGSEFGGERLELALMDYPGSTDPSDDLGYFRTEAIGADNWSRFADAEFDRLFEKCLGESDPAVRDANYRHMQDRMERSGGFLFLTGGALAAIARDGITPVILSDDRLDLPRTTRN